MKRLVALLIRRSKPGGCLKRGVSSFAFPEPNHNREKENSIMNGTLLHGKGEVVNRDELAMVLAPLATRTYTPIPHVELLDAVKREVTSSGLVVAEETLSLSHARNGCYGDRFFGLLEIEGEADLDFHTTVGLRNSHDRVIPCGLCVGSRVLVCSNLAFSAEIVISRRHTSRIRQDLPRLINEAVGKLGDLRNHQTERIEAYQNTAILEPQVHDLVVRAMDAKVLAASKIPRVLAEFRDPPHEEFQPRTVWSLFNAFTNVLKEYDLLDLPRRTQTLHGLCDMQCHLS
jgi:hypothetical protein